MTTPDPDEIVRQLRVRGSMSWSSSAEQRFWLNTAADELERLTAELERLRTRPYWEDPDYQDWLNDLGENIPDSYDGDDAMEDIVLRYVRDLEAEVERLRAENPHPQPRPAPRSRPNPTTPRKPK